MSDITVARVAMLAVTAEMRDKVNQVEALLLTCPQPEVATEHILHGGMYARTVRIPAGMAFTNALIKRATMLIINGDIQFTLNDGVGELHGYNVIPASAGRKSVFVTLGPGPVEMTMLFPTTATTVEQAEAEYTDDAGLLHSRRQGSGDTITITGE